MHPAMHGYRGSSFKFVQMAFEAIFKISLKNAQIKGELNYIFEFNVYLSISWALIVLSSITKKGEIESAYGPLSEFWC